MDLQLETWGVLIGLIITIVGAIWAAIKAASAAYQESVEKAATKIENERLAKQAEATVNSLKAELTECKAENQRLWQMVNTQEGRA